MTAKTATKTISLPIGLAARAKNAGLNVSGVCADALNRAIIALEQRKEYESAKMDDLTAILKKNGIIEQLENKMVINRPLSESFEPTRDDE